MKFILPIIITVLVMIAPLSLSATEKKGTRDIKSIFFQKINGREVVQIRLSGKVVPKVFELGGDKPRVVLDFVETGYEPNKIRTIKAGGVLVSKIRVGLHAKPIAKTRVVIDMVEGMKYTYSKEYIATNTIFRITFTSPQTHIAEQEKEKIVPTEQEKKTEAVVQTEGQSKNRETSINNNEVEKSATEKKVEAITTAVNPPAQISDESETTSEGIGDGATVSRDELPEVKEEGSAFSVKPVPPIVKDENTQIVFDVNYEKNTNGNEMVLFRLNGFYPPVVYSTESGELFVVCDFLDSELGPGNTPVSTKGGQYIRQIKVESYQQPKKVRVVIELVDRFTYDVKQVFFKEDNLFVIVINSLGEKNTKT